MAYPNNTVAPKYVENAPMRDGLDSLLAFDWDSKIHTIEPSMSGLWTLLKNLGGKKVTSYAFEWFEDRPTWYQDRVCWASTVSTGIDSAFVSRNVSVAAGTAFALVMGKTVGTTTAVSWITASSGQDGLVIRITSANDTTKYLNALVTSTSSGNKLTCKVIGGTGHTATFFKVNYLSGTGVDRVDVIGTAFADGGEAANAYSYAPQTRWGEVQTFKTAIKITRRAKLASIKTEGDWMNWLMRKSGELKRDIAMAFYWGIRNGATASDPYSAPGSPLTDANGLPVTFTMGLYQGASYASTTTTFGGSKIYSITKATYTYSDFISDCQNIFQFGSKNKKAICGAGVITFFNQLAISEQMITMTPMSGALGVKVFELVTAHGTLYLQEEPLFTSSSVHTNFMFIIDMENIELMEYTPITLEDITPVGYDGKKFQWLYDAGLKVMAPETHAVVILK